MVASLISVMVVGVLAGIGAGAGLAAFVWFATGVSPHEFAEWVRQDMPPKRVTRRLK